METLTKEQAIEFVKFVIEYNSKEVNGLVPFLPIEELFEKFIN